MYVENNTPWRLSPSKPGVTKEVNFPANSWAKKMGVVWVQTWRYSCTRKLIFSGCEPTLTQLICNSVNWPVKRGDNCYIFKHDDLWCNFRDVDMGRWELQPAPPLRAKQKIRTSLWRSHNSHLHACVIFDIVKFTNEQWWNDHWMSILYYNYTLCCTLLRSELIFLIN